MAKKNVKHTTIRNEKIFCLHCGGEYTLRMPIGIPEMTKKIEAFNELHGDCLEFWTEPKADPNKKVEERAYWWMLNGEVGMSSKTIWSVMMGMGISKRDYPHDPGDFSRCYKLLEAIPEWKSQLNRLKPVSKQWSNLVENWDRLTEMYEQNVNEEWKNVDEIGMHVLMDTLTE
jgi:hypothetical protein